MNIDLHSFTQIEFQPQWGLMTLFLATVLLPLGLIAHAEWKTRRRAKRLSQLKGEPAADKLKLLK